MAPRAFLNWLGLGQRCLACGVKGQPLGNNGAGLFCESCWLGGWGAPPFRPLTKGGGRG